MCTYETNVNNLVLIIDNHYEPVFVTFYVKYYAIIPNKTSIAIIIFNITCCFPISLFCFSVPSP